MKSHIKLVKLLKAFSQDVDITFPMGIKAVRITITGKKYINKWRTYLILHDVKFEEKILDEGWVSFICYYDT